MARIENDHTRAKLLGTAIRQFKDGVKATSREPFWHAVGFVIPAEKASKLIGVQPKQLRKAIESFPERKLRDFVDDLDIRVEAMSRSQSGAPHPVPGG